VVMSKVKKDLFILGLGRGLQVLAAFFNLKLLSSFLEASEAGLYFFMLAISSYIGLVVVNPMGTYILRQIHPWRDKKILTPIMLQFFVIILLFHILIFPLLNFLSHGFSVDERVRSLVVLSALFYSLAQSIGNTYVPALNILNYRFSFVILTVLTHTMGLVASWCLIHFYGAFAYFWLTGLSLTYLIFGLGGLLLLWSYLKEPLSVRSIKESYQALQFKELWSFAAPILVTNLFMWLMSQSYRAFTEQLSTLEFLGYAGFGLTMASQLSVSFEYLLHQLYLPSFYEKISSNDKNQREMAWNKLASLSLPIYFSLAVFTSALAPFIIRIVTTPEYKLAAYFLAAGIWAETFRATATIFSLIGHSEMKTSRLIRPYAWGGSITVALFFAFYYMGIYEMALPWGILVGQLVTILFLYLQFHSHFSIQLDTIAILKKWIPSIIFLTTLLLYPQSDDFFSSFIIVAMSGLIFLGLQYRGIHKI
jgi:O-antigen/teichoic acid export membrane protein